MANALVELLRIGESMRKVTGSEPCRFGRGGLRRSVDGLDKKASKSLGEVHFSCLVPGEGASHGSGDGLEKGGGVTGEEFGGGAVWRGPPATCSGGELPDRIDSARMAV